MLEERIVRNIVFYIVVVDGNFIECEILLNDEKDGIKGVDVWWEDESYLRWNVLYFVVNG